MKQKAQKRALCSAKSRVPINLDSLFGTVVDGQLLIIDELGETVEGIGESSPGLDGLQGMIPFIDDEHQTNLDVYYYVYFEKSPNFDRDSKINLRFLGCDFPRSELK